jgi:hypothetical protein
MPVILATQEAEIRRIDVRNQPRAHSLGDFYLGKRKISQRKG